MTKSIAIKIDYCIIEVWDQMVYLFQKGSQEKFLKKFLFVAQATEIVSPLRYTFKCNQSDT